MTDMFAADNVTPILALSTKDGQEKWKGKAGENNPVIVVDVDLNKQKLWPWIGDLKSRISREMPPQKAIH